MVRTSDHLLWCEPHARSSGAEGKLFHFHSEITTNTNYNRELHNLKRGLVSSLSSAREHIVKLPGRTLNFTYRMNPRFAGNDLRVSARRTYRKGKGRTSQKMCKKEEAEANSILSTTAFSQSRSILCVFGSFVINGLRSGPLFTDIIL